MRDFDPARSAIRFGAVAPVADSRALRSRRFPLPRATLDARLLEHRLGLLGARLTQQSAQGLECRLAILQQLGHVAQRADRGFQFLIAGLTQRFPHALQQRLQLFGGDVEWRCRRLHLGLLE
jgi:hypothetical protein